MRRALWFRSLASLLALWLPLVAGEPGLLHPCPMHGAGRAVVASLRGETVHAPATQHAHHHAGMAAADQQPNHSPAPAHDHHSCTCIDCCAVSAGAFVAPAAPAVTVAVVAYVATRSLPGVESLARPAPEYSRPYTTGPPRA